MSIRSEEDLIFSTLRFTHPSAVADGVVHEPEFLSARYRIIYILKEVNGGFGWDLRDFVYDGGRPQTWDNIARWTEGILSWENEIPYATQRASGICYQYMVVSRPAKSENPVSY
jgi:hypothetical protein